VVWPLGLGLLLLRQDLRGAGRWLAVAGVSIAAYFIGYDQPAGNPPPKGSAGDILRGWLAFNGAGAEAFPVADAFAGSLLLGALLTGLTVLLLTYRLGQFLRGRPLTDWDRFFVGLAGFTLGTGLIVAYSRAGFGLETLITSRYKIYSLLLLATLSSYAVVCLGRPAAWAATAFAGLLALFSYSSYLDETVFLRQSLLAMQFNWTYTTNRPVSTIDPTTRRLVRNAPAFYDRQLTQVLGPADPARPAEPLRLTRQAGTFTIQSERLLPTNRRDGGAYLRVRSAARTYLFPARQNLSGSRRAWLQPGRTFGPGFTAQVAEAELDKGRYEVAILALDPNGNCQLLPTTLTLESSGPPAPEIDKNW